MNKLTGDEIIEHLKTVAKTALSEYKNPVKTFAYEEFNENELGLGKIVNVDVYGGEGKGDTWYRVFHFVDHDVYLKVNGWYSSYEGVDLSGEWNCVKEVKPTEKTITVYS